ncbi:toxic anion resistance protein [Chitinivorax sp. B]|uniref:toxic anion resistance protein n=1 Tax=Chitinivorax sp. B TaxID=2502235 RepID=UPI0010F5DD78|nr:toxic anion resistance protein [Chitinivorax sp. B]
MTQYKDLFGGGTPAPRPTTTAPQPTVATPIHTPQPANLVPTIDLGMQAPVTAVAPAVDNALVAQIRQISSDRLEEIGGRQTQQLVGLSEQLLAKTRATDTGEFGRGMNDILRLMSTVQYDQLGEPSGVSGLINKVKRTFKVAKVDVVQAFDSAKGQIDKISNDMRSRLRVMDSDNQWLINAYNANLVDMQSLEQILPAVQIVLEEEQQKLAAMDPSDPMKIAEQRQRVDRLNRRAETIALQIHQAKLRAFQIKGLEDANKGITDDFRSLLENAIPAWGTDISMGLLSLRQKANIEISNRVKDQIQTSMKRAADQIHDNVINSEKALQRQAVDVNTLQHVQDKTIDMIRQKVQLAEQRSQQRAQTMQELARMDTELKQSLTTK